MTLCRAPGAQAAQAVITTPEVATVGEMVASIMRKAPVVATVEDLVAAAAAATCLATVLGMTTDTR